jgi:hypothetical protein
MGIALLNPSYAGCTFSCTEHMTFNEVKEDEIWVIWLY